MADRMDALGLAGTFAATVIVLFLRRSLRREHDKRGRGTLLFLVLSLVLWIFIVAAHAMGYAPKSVAYLVAILLLAFGLTGLVALVAFDIVLDRFRVVVPPLVRDLGQALVLGIIVFSVLRAAGVDLVSLVTTSAVLTAVIGLALQSTISNLFAGLSLQVDRTLSVGDWVQINQRIGRITQIKWRSTFLVTRDGDNVILPNSVLLGNEVLNFSQPTRQHRLSLRLGFAYRHPPNDVKRTLLEAVRGVPGVLPAPAPDCFPCEFGESAIIYALRYWIDDVERESGIEGEIRTRIWYAAQRAALEIPFPIRSIYMTEITQDHLTREQEREFLERAAALAKIDLFAPLEPGEREILARTMKKVSFAGGEDIIRQGDPGDSLYVIQDGEVGVRLAVEGAVREVATLRAGDFFGEMSLMTGEPRRATCAAKADVACYLIDKEAFSQVLEVKPQVVEQISTILGSRQTALEGERDNLSAEAKARRAAENSSKLLARIRNFFNLG
jgi:small-conductance mechanosensitive channel/CRP-like cAMP-binding protein